MIEGYSDYEKRKVIDSNNIELGDITDFTLDPNSYQVHDFIIEGQNPEIQKFLNITSTYKLLVPWSSIRRRTKDGDVVLSVSGNVLEHISKMSEKVIRFSSLRSADVISHDLEDVGRVIDALIHKDNHFSFILGGSPFKEFLGRIGLQEPLHLLLPYSYIEKMNSNLIVIDKSKEELSEFFNRTELDSDGMRLLEERKKASKESRLLLYKESFQDVFQANEKTSY